MKEKKTMRGIYWWIILALCVLWFGKTMVEIFTVGFGRVMHSDSGWGVIVPILYFVAWFIVPPLYQKFFVVPPVDRTVSSAAENVQLEAPATLRIRRVSSVIGAALPFTVLLNGQPVCTLKNGESAQITLTMKHNVLLIDNIASAKARFELDAPSGGAGTVDMGYGEFKVKTLQWNK